MTAFDLERAEPPVRPDIVESLRREWASLARAGSWFTGEQRIAVAAAARGVAEGATSDTALPDAVGEAVERLVAAPGAIRRDWVEDLAARGLPAAGYVETIGITSRIAAVDGFHGALGIELPPLPAPVDGPPSGETDPAARPTKAFIPMTRGTSIWWSLAMVPHEAERMADLHCTLYLSPEQMQQPDSPRAITRPQIELVATRTSVLNDCFY